jgi:hypothetical protein
MDARGKTALDFFSSSDALARTDLQASSCNFHTVRFAVVKWNYTGDEVGENG